MQRRLEKYTFTKSSTLIATILMPYPTQSPSSGPFCCLLGNVGQKNPLWWYDQNCGHNRMTDAMLEFVSIWAVCCHCDYLCICSTRESISVPKYSELITSMDHEEQKV